MKIEFWVCAAENGIEIDTFFPTVSQPPERHVFATIEEANKYIKEQLELYEQSE